MKIFNEYLGAQVKIASDEFGKEISTDENRDYRRGYRAGVLFSLLQIKSSMGNFNYDPTVCSGD